MTNKVAFKLNHDYARKIFDLLYAVAITPLGILILYPVTRFEFHSEISSCRWIKLLAVISFYKNSIKQSGTIYINKVKHQVWTGLQGILVVLLML